MDMTPKRTCKLGALPYDTKFIFASAKGWAQHPGVYTKPRRERWDRRGTIVAGPDGIERVMSSNMVVQVVE